MQNNLEKPVGRLMLTLCAQSAFSQLIYQLYSLTDTFFVANGVGTLASGAIGIVSPVLTLINGISTTLGTGGASMISRHLGEGNTSQSKAVVGCMFFVWLVCSLTVTAMGLVFLKPILFLLNCPLEIYPYAWDYGRIMLLSTVMSTGFSSIMRAQGDICYSTIQWVCPVIVNLILDPVFICQFQMGIAGAAWATCIAQLLSAASSVYYFFFRKTTPCRVGVRNIRWEPMVFRKMASIGLPAFLGSLGGSIAGTLANQVVGTVGGAGAIGAFVVANRIQSFASTPFSGVMQGIQPMLGFDSGRSDQKRVRRTMRLAALFVLVYGCAAAVWIHLSADRILKLFTEDPKTLSAGGMSLKILCWALVPGGILPVVQAYLQALGQGKRVLSLSLGSVFLIRLPMLAAARFLGTLSDVWWVLVFTDWLIALWALYQYHRKEEN